MSASIGLWCCHLQTTTREPCMDLVAPCCVIPRDYLSDTPLLRRDAEAIILITFAFSRGSGRAKIEENLSKNAVFLGKYHDNEIRKICECHCQKFCCHFGGPYCALWGFWCLNMANWVRYPLYLFSAFPPWRPCEVEVRYPPPPPPKGVSHRYLRDTL